MLFTDRKGHLVSNLSLQELHDFAAGIGLKLEWFQNKRVPHYDLITPRMRQKALRAGATLCGSREIVRLAKSAEISQ